MAYLNNSVWLARVFTANTVNDSDATRPGSDAFLRPYLHAMAGLQRYDGLSLDQLSVQAERLLLDTFGPSEAPAASRAAPGTLALLGEHTYYFDGFALLLPMPFGTAVAVRRAAQDDAAVVFDAPRRVVPLAKPEGSRASDVPGDRIVGAVLEGYGAFQAAVVSTIPSGCADGALAALAVAVMQAAAGPGADAVDLIHRATAAVADRIERPYGVAPVLGAWFGEFGSALAVDTATLEYVTLDLPARERLAWALVDVGPRPVPAAGVYRRRRELVAEAGERLRGRVTTTDGVTTDGVLRALEHRHLEAALRALPRRLRAPVRHLVTENRRVQQVITAIRRVDCQLLGGMLLISQASLETDWRDSDDGIRRVMALGEERESLYGGRMVGREFGHCVLLAGQPAAAGRLVEDLRRDPPPDLAGQLETWLF